MGMECIETTENSWQERQSVERKPAVRWPAIVLAIVLLAAGVLRLDGINWDEGTHLHPDERFLTTVEAAISPTFSLAEYFNTAASPLNPANHGQPFFVYGTLPIFLTRYVAEGLNAACGSAGCAYNWAGYDGAHLVGRALSALFDLGTILVLFAIGRRLYGERVGVLAAVLAAAAVLNIQQSHFFTVDTFLTFFAGLAIYYAVRVAQEGEWRDWILFGMALGMALACKISAWPLSLVLVAAAGIRVVNHNHGANHSPILLPTTATIAFLVFRVLQPYAFAGPGFTPEKIGVERFTAAAVAAPAWWGEAYDLLPAPLRTILLPAPQWLSSMETIRHQMSGDVDFPPNHQWTDRTPIVFPWKNMVLYGLGPALGLAAWIGLAAAAVVSVRSLRRGRQADWQRHLLPLVWVLVFFLYQGTQWVKSMRYLLPIYPMLILLAAWMLATAWERWGRRRWAAALLIGLVIVPTWLWACAFTGIYRQPLTRVAASRWAYQNVPTGATLLYESTQGPAELSLPIYSHLFTQDGVPLVVRFAMPVDGVATGVRLNYLSDPNLDAGDEVMRVALATLDDGRNVELAAGQIAVDLQYVSHVRGDAYTVEFEPTSLAAGGSYALITEVAAGAPVRSTGAFLVSESSWDDAIPWRIDGLEPFAIYEGQPLELYWEDNVEKKERMISLLHLGEYLIVSSTRQLGSLTRLPPRYPMTIAFYEALFDGRLGYELAETYEADIHIGPLYINDVFGRLSWGRPPDTGWPPPGFWAAEEAFSVYDHPPVWVFKKRADYTPSAIRTFFDSIDISDQRFVRPLEYTQELNAKRQAGLLDALLPGDQAAAKDEPDMMLPADELTAQRSGGTWREMFDPDGLLSTSPVLGAAVWWLLVVGLGWLAFPLAFVAFNGLPSKGYVVSKVVALLAVAWLGWMAGSLKLLPYTHSTILLAVGMLALTGLVLGFWRRKEIGRFLQSHWRLLVVAEALGLLLYILSLLIRSGNPDLWHPVFGGEKPLDFAFLNAVLKSTSFPPYDPWLAGAYINYYYFGYVLIGSPIKLLGIVPNVAYNLALPMLFSLTGLGAFSVAVDLVAGRSVAAEPAGRKRFWRRALIAGLAAAVMVVLLGNLGQLWTLVDGWNRLGGPEGPWITQTARGLWANVTGRPIPMYSTGSWYWNATRIIPPATGEAGPITEFPFFTFLYADLHAHMMDMPLVLLALAWALGLAQAADRLKRRRPGWGWLAARAIPTAVTSWLIGGLVVGAVRATNTWDWPTVLGIGAVAVVYAAWRGIGRGLRWLMAAGAGLVGLVALSMLSFLPYTQHFVPAFTEVMRWEGGITPIWAYFAVHGLFLFLLLTVLGREFRDWTRNLTDEWLELLEPWGGVIGLGVLTFVGAMAALLLMGVPVGPLVVLAMAPAGLLALQPRLPAERRAVLMLFTLGLALTLAVELVVFSGDISRMNTVFKFYMQVWLIFSAIGGAALVWAWDSVGRWRPLPRQSWLVALMALLFAAALYPPTATRAKVADRFHAEQPPAGLDGMAYMLTAVHQDQGQVMPLEHDYGVIRWLQDNVDGSPVIMEANTYPTKIYGWGNRISIYTGLPSVVGWEWHTRQHRAGFEGATELVRQRANEVIAFYNTPDVQQAVDILRSYDVQYVIVGPLERAYHSPVGLDKFELMVRLDILEEVYRNDGAVIYRVV